MPNLHRLVEEEGLAIGAPGRGGQISASGPQFISLPGYIEIFAGKTDPGCLHNACKPAALRTVADQVRDASGTDDVEIVSSWPTIARAASADPDFAISAGRNRLEREDRLRGDVLTAKLIDQGARAGAFPGEGDYRPDAFTAQVALRRLVTARPRFLFVGLGDADEYAHRNDYRSYLKALRASDAFLGELADTLQTMGARGRHTTILVTADHGRGHDFVDHGRQFPESGRVWLVAAGADVAGRGLVSASRRHTLSDVAPTIRALLGIAEPSESGAGRAIPEIVAPPPPPPPP
jgi:arylsulfatase A-like enzyme